MPDGMPPPPLADAPPAPGTTPIANAPAQMDATIAPPPAAETGTDAAATDTDATASATPVEPPTTIAQPPTTPVWQAEPLLIEHERGPGPLLIFALLAVTALVALGWWFSRRHSRRLADEAQRLARQERQLRTAHQTLQHQSAQLRELSILDPLTGTLNRQAFASELRELIESLGRAGRPLNLIVFDLDHFKTINDRFGHLAGDAALKLVVGTVRERLVSADLFGRFGGDEFLIACADQPLESCAALANTIREAIVARAPTHEPPLPGLSLSMGIAQANPDTGYASDALFARADAALYAAKRAGRNQVVVADSALPPPPEAATANRHL